jgi:hypothetical protein
VTFKDDCATDHERLESAIMAGQSEFVEIIKEPSMHCNLATTEEEKSEDSMKSGSSEEGSDLRWHKDAKGPDSPSKYWNMKRLGKYIQAGKGCCYFGAMLTQYHNLIKYKPRI